MAERSAVVPDRAALADRCARQGSCGRPSRDQRHPACAEKRLPVVRLSAGIWPSEDDLQSVCSLGGTRSVGAIVPCACKARPRHGGADDRCHARQGPPLGLGRKKGEHKQAIGRSRGGRNTKIHAIADAKGRLLSILLRLAPVDRAAVVFHRKTVSELDTRLDANIGNCLHPCGLRDLGPAST